MQFRNNSIEEMGRGITKHKAVFPLSCGTSFFRFQLLVTVTHLDSQAVGLITHTKYSLSITSNILLYPTFLPYLSHNFQI
jgi:hypothetical protein